MQDIPQELVIQAQRGNQMAFERIYRITVPSVYRTVAHIASRVPHEVDDIVQKVFIEVHRSLPSFERRSRFSTWLYRVSVNTALKHVRSWRKWLPATGLDLDSFSDGSSSNPEKELQARRVISKANKALASMAVKKRTVFVLHEIEGLATDEIASVLEVPVATVNSRLFHARKEIWKAMDRESRDGRAYAFC